MNFAADRAGATDAKRASVVHFAQDKFLQKTIKIYLEQAQVPGAIQSVSEGGRSVRSR